MDSDEEEDNNDWERSLESDILETEGSSTDRVSLTSQRVILHFDLDCFYAQVEMIRNPALRTKPLGIQQKYIIVTSNYVARELGVNKLMSVTDAVEKCPQLVLVKGEDLTYYREMSYKVTELLMSYCPLVERLGFDENFMDVTEMVEKRIKETRISDLSFNGHVYNHERIGYKTREKLKVLGLVNVRDLQLYPLSDLVKEFGEMNAKRIQNLACGIDDSPVTPAGPPQSLSDEDSFKKMSTLEEVLKKIEELLINLTERMHKDGRQPHTLRLTIRKYTVTNRWFNRESRQCPIPNHTGLKITGGSSEAVPQLLSLSMKLFHKMVDPHQPFHLTLLNVCFSNLQAKSSSKSSIASFFTHKSPSTTQIPSQQVDSDLCESVATSHFTQADVLHKNDKAWKPVNNTSISPTQTQSTSVNPKSSLSPRQPVSEHSQHANINIRPPCLSSAPKKTLHFKLPPNVDADVFKLLPEHIQMELMSSFKKGDSVYRPADTEDVDPEHQATFASRQKTPKPCESAVNVCTNSASNPHELSQNFSSPQSIPEFSSELVMVTESDDIPHSTQAIQPEVPANVDPYVFSQLPADVQRELLTEWRQQRPVLKIPSKHSHKSSNSRDRKTSTKGNQCNNILKYFKPN